MPKDLDLIKEKIDLVDFLRGYLNLYPAGRNFKALCPFHQEKSPSFIVSPQRQIWHCFGCGAGGDILGFVMKYENLEFGEALRFLAEKAGLEIQAFSPSLQKEYGALYSVNNAAEEFFVDELSKNKEAIMYLRERGLRDETIHEFKIGYAPAGGDLLITYLINAGYDLSDIIKAGLAYKNEKGLHRDRFEGRIIFPIKNHFGRTVAFTGRILPGKESDDRPKYLNSPETPIFIKSKILYGLHKSKQAIAAERSVFLVEGQMDFLMSWQTGIKNCAAVSGTGLTPQHLERLRRLADTVLLTFDNDEAGLKALERSLDVFSNFDFHVKVVDLGSYKDPAEAASVDPTHLSQATTWAKPAFSYLFNAYLAPEIKSTLGIAEKKRIVRHLLTKIKNLKSAVEQSIWVKELAKYSGIGEPALIRELENIQTKVELNPAAAQSRPEFVERLDRIAGRLVSLALVENKYAELLKQKIEFLPADYRNILNDPGDKRRDLLDLKSSFEFSNLNQTELEREFNDLMRHLELEFLKKERARLRSQIDSEVTLSKIHDLSKRIDELSRPA